MINNVGLGFPIVFLVQDV